MFLQVCRGVAHAHSKGVLHRDIKPDNVLLRDDHSPIVSDFGLCLVVDEDRHLTEEFEPIGARWYMAPELEDGRLENADARSDIYSLGKLLYWFFAGKVFSREKHKEAAFDLRRSHEGKAIHFVYELLDATIAHDPGKRGFENASEFATAVEQILRRIEMGANVIGWEVPQTCLYCGGGTYQRAFSNFIDNNPEDSGFNFGIQLVNPRHHKWLVLACDNCGHLQWFRPDLSKDKTIWDKK